MLSKNKKIVVVVLIIAAVLIIVVFSLKSYLYLKLLFGHDVLIRLETSEDDLNLVHNQQEDIEIITSIKANPFCKVACSYTFIDLGDNKIIDESSFSLKSLAPIKKTYTIWGEKFGSGQDLYRAELECYGVKTFLCDTNEVPVKRTALVTVEYELSDNEKILEEKLKNNLEFLKLELSRINNSLIAFEKSVDEANKYVVIDDLYLYINAAKFNENRIVNDFLKLKDYWSNYDYYTLEEKLKDVNKSYLKLRDDFKVTNETIVEAIKPYNDIVLDLIKAYKDIEYIKNNIIYVNNSIFETNLIVEEYNKYLREFKKRSDINDKKNLLDEFLVNNGTIYLIKERLKEESIRNELDLMINYDSLCYIKGDCVNYSTIEKIANKNDYNLREICSDVESYYLRLNKSIDLTEYPNDEEFWSNVSFKVNNIKQNIINDYLRKLPENSTNSDLIKNILVKKEIIKTNDYDYDLTNALLFKLINQSKNCSVYNGTISNLDKFDIKVAEINIEDKLLKIDFSEKLPKCCLNGDCYDCCLSEDCLNDKYPIIFVHGHQFNKDLPAEYTLDKFDLIQKRLEKDGYYDAGIIYASMGDSKEGVLGLSNIAWTFRTSYYLDVFRQPKGYVWIQTKNESIEDYALRLRKIIDNVKYKTNKKKVVVIAHSMGGLVARRYIQVFGGNDVEKLILITVPNNGIEGDISRLCSLFGEETECRDMNKDSEFMNRLNSERLPNIEIYNIIGSGCLMDNEDGDGIVLKRNAILDNVNNSIIKGSCEATRHLHGEILGVNKYPKLYEIVIDALE